MEATTGNTAVEKGSGRDSRRRRIADRGSDRLALITGRIKALPSESEPEPEPGSNQSRGHAYTASCPPSISQIHLASSQSSGTHSNHYVVFIYLFNCSISIELLLTNSCKQLF